MPSKRLSLNPRKDKSLKSNSECQSFSPPSVTSIKKARKAFAKENKHDISNSKSRTDERKVLVSKPLNIYEGVKEGKEKLRAGSASKVHSELVDDSQLKISKKSKKIVKKSTWAGGYDADVSFAPDSSSEVKKKTKKLKTEKSSAVSVPAIGNGSLECDGEEEPDNTSSDHGDTLSDHGDTLSDGDTSESDHGDTVSDIVSEGDCSDDCEEECLTKKGKHANDDNLSNSVSDDGDIEDDGDIDDDLEDDEDCDVEQDKVSEVGSRSRYMIDDEAEEADSSEDEHLDSCNESYEMYFESGSCLKGIKPPPKDIFYNSAKEEEEMEADDDFIVSDTNIEYNDQDDSWLDDEPETKQKKYARIVPCGGDSSSDEEADRTKLAAHNSIQAAEHEEASPSDSEEETTTVQPNNLSLAENGSCSSSGEKDEPATGKENTKVGKRDSGGKMVNAIASEIRKAGTASDHKSKSSAPKNRVPGDSNVIKDREERPEPEPKRHTLTILQRLFLIRNHKPLLLNLGRELIKSERQFI